MSIKNIENPKKKIILPTLILLIIVWQVFNIFNREKYSSQYSIKSVKGLNHNVLKHFVYFYYYLDLYPVATTQDIKYTNKYDAKAILNKYPNNLLNDLGHTTRYGDHGRILLYLPSIWLQQLGFNLSDNRSINPSVKHFTVSFFVLSLIALLLSFYHFGKPFLGVLLVFVIGSNPLMLYEVYSNQNIFSLPISLALLIMSLNIVFLKEINKYYYYLLIPIISGVLYGFFKHVRTETISTIISCFLLYLLVPKLKPNKKLIMITLLLASFVAANICLNYYFDYKFNQAVKVVEKAGGSAYKYRRVGGHPFWHPLFVGFGEFDNKYGYRSKGFEDLSAYNYAFPILQKRLKEENNEIITYKPEDSSSIWNKYRFQEYYDNAKKYYKKFEDYPQYYEILKDKIKADFINDPLYFLGIWSKRAVNILTDTVPLTFSIAGISLNLPLNGWPVILLIIFFIYKREWLYLKLIIFSMPLAAPALIMWSSLGMTYYSLYHLIAYVVFFYYVYLYVIKIIKYKQRVSY